MKKRIISLLLVVSMVLSLLPVSALAAGTKDTAADSPFTDVKPGDWCYDAVLYAKANGFFSGTSETTFSPNGTMTRGMFVTVLGRMAGIDPAKYGGDTGFTDVPEGMYYAPYVKWAAQYGITGGTGAGKTSALQALEALGGTVLDCDAVYHQALREDEALRSRIRDAFGEVFRGTELDRQKLGSLVFSDPQALERLNGIIFDYLPGVLRRRLEGKVLVGLDAINLMESGLGELCCRTVAVLAPGEQRVQRIMQRDHIPEEYARLRIQAQKPDSYYREHCTDVLENQEETPEAFREKAEIFFRDLLRQLHHITEGGHEQ